MKEPDQLQPTACYCGARDEIAAGLLAVKCWKCGDAMHPWGVIRAREIRPLG